MLGHNAADWTVVAVFATVYLGMLLGGLPRLNLDRSGMALSNLVSNVPAVMLLLPHLGSNASEAVVLLALVGSIAKLIVVDLVARQGIAID